jgi:hypothetical protein
MKSWREEELERLKKEYAFYRGTEIKDKLTGGLRSQTLKWIIDYHERMLGIKFWGEDIIEQNERLH